MIKESKVIRPFIKNERASKCSNDLIDVINDYQDLSLENLVGILQVLILDLYNSVDED